MYNVVQLKDDTDKVFMKNEEGGGGLASIEDCDTPGVTLKLL